MLKAMEHIRYLVDVVGYRSPTTEGERWASKYIAGVLDKAGVENQVETFRTPRTFSYPYMAILALVALGGLVACGCGFTGFVLSAVGAVAYFLEGSCRSVAGRIVPREESQNVVGRIAAVGEVRRRVVLCAHYDTSRSGWLASPRLVGYFRTLVILTTVAVFAIPVLIVLGGLFWDDLFGFLRGVSVLWLVFVLILLLQREVYGLNVYGANDNASGTGVVLSLAESLSAKPLKNTETWIVATGSEEAGLAGMLAFLRRHDAELRDALIINVDSVGAGQIKYLTGESMVRACPSDPELLMLSAEVVRENPDLSPVPHEYRQIPTDAFAALSRGFRAMTITALDEDGTVPNAHWETDVIENLEERNLEDVTRFLETLLTKIDSE